MRPVELSPLVYAELYGRLAADGSRQEALAERLEQIELNGEWLGKASAAYRAKWKDEVSKRQADPAYELIVTSPEHAELASWIMAPLRTSGSSYDLDQELRKAVLDRATRELPGQPDPAALLAAFHPSVTCWILGMVVGSFDLTVPVVPAYLPADEHICDAYEGLVRHAEHLGDVAEPWTEMLGTSTIWRGTGICEALRPDQGGQAKSITALFAEAKHYLPEHLWKQWFSHFRGFVDRRDVLSHVAPKDGGITFAQARATALTSSQVRPTLAAIALFICQTAARELAETMSSNVARPGVWDALRWDVEVYS
jgi:hypothetical protein